MPTHHYAIHLTATFFGQTVEERLMGRGESVELGEDGPVAIPIPKDWPYVAKIDWVRPGQARVVDGEGRQFIATMQSAVEIDKGPLVVRIEVAQQFRLRRVPYLASAISSLAGLVIIGQLILSLGLVTGQGVQSCEVYCGTWLGHYSQKSNRGAWETPLFFTDRLCQCPGPPIGQAGENGAAANDLVAEYLERLLKNDLDGHEDGMIVRKERPTGDRKNESFYLPAGDKGPADEMGGASETALRPERNHSDPEMSPESSKKKSELLANEDMGTPVDLPGVEDDAQADAETEDAEDGELEMVEPAAEEEEGWGVRDWYDAEDKVRDEMEIEAMTRLAKRILKINPNDPEALSILSYYQYLSED